MKSISHLLWNQIYQDLNTYGYGKIPNLLDLKECQVLIAQYDNDSLYRSKITMARYNFGQGEYKYFTYPLPIIIEKLRSEFYPYLAYLANKWCQQLNIKLSILKSMENIYKNVTY
ncbi:hypothetical protein NURINAE_00694 [Candidatus Nitrosacidococcus sp. I8]|nr:2OG-Fe(II) oxygenase [Candidatus Nitrosacidococcus sp. I8]CAH9018043.1 hypothetical protein NURINAE_00694 [Candidatus Nitrosacidococcus sp. I8]